MEARQADFKEVLKPKAVPAASLVDKPIAVITVVEKHGVADQKKKSAEAPKMVAQTNSISVNNSKKASMNTTSVVEKKPVPSSMSKNQKNAIASNSIKKSAPVVVAT